MRLLFSLNHPAHYYLFKYIIRGFRDNGDEVVLVIRQKDILEKLLKSEGQDYIKINEKKKRDSNTVSIILNSMFELVIQNLNLLKQVQKFKPQILLGTDISITHIGKLINIPSFVYNEDDFEINRLFCFSSYPFADFIIAPIYTSVGPYKKKKIPYNGIQKMSYLNPKYFLPNNNILKKLKIKEKQNYFIIRLVSLTSVHDVEGNHKGINNNLLRKIINKLNKRGKVFISTEITLPVDLKPYELKIAPNKMHDLMYYASLFIGDSQSMCAESGILGTPFIRFNDFVGKIEYLNDLENNYKLGWGVKTDQPEKVLKIIDKLFSDPNYKEKWVEKKRRLFKEKIDLTAFSISLIKNFPNSIIKRNNFEYQ
jgi:hypothetical protein